MAETPHRGKRDKLGQMARPIQLPWTCHQTGDCCRTRTPLTVSAVEKRIMEEQGNLATRTPIFTLHPSEEAQREALRAQGEIIMPEVTFYQLERGPCPFLAGTACIIYNTRPYNCRRFICGRVDPTQESFEEGPDGCFNLSDRTATSARFEEFAAATQRRAQKWALENGWKR